VLRALIARLMIFGIFVDIPDVKNPRARGDVSTVIIAVINAQHVVIIVLYTYAVRYNVNCTYESMYLCYKGKE
jgi:hypothetical protein